MKPIRTRAAHSRLQTVVLPVTAVSMLALSTSLAAAVNVRTQPSGATASTSYTLVGESRAFFGHAVDSTSGTYSCRWSIDGALGASFTPSDPTLIETAASFANSGLHTVTLTCSDGANPAESDSSTIEVLALGSDTSLRQKNSAIDKGLGYSYRQQDKSSGCFGGDGFPVASTGMALVAMENHGHNLDSDGEDIYRWSLEKGLQCLYDNSATVEVTNQPCIGDPESDDGDNESDDKGIRFASGAQYEGPFAVLAIVNATTAANAATIHPSTSVGSDLIDGSNSLVEIVRDARDYLAWSMTDLTDFSGGSGYSQTLSCEAYDADFNQVGYFVGSTGPAGVDWKFDGWAELGAFPAPGIPGGQCGSVPTLWDLDFGDGTSVQQTGNCYGGGSLNGDPTSSRTWIDSGSIYRDYGGEINHSFTAAGTYTVAAEVFPTALCSFQVQVPEPPVPGQCAGNGWRYSENDSSIDNSVAQWPTLALYEAYARWGIDSKQVVKDQLEGWLDYTQDPAGGSLGGGSYGYSAPGDWLNTAKAGAGLIMRHFTGHALADAENQLSLDFIGNDWDRSGVNSDYGNKGSLYAMYAVFKGLKLYGEATIEVPAGGPAIDWNADYDAWLVGNQQSDGAWDTEYWMGTQMTTYFGVAILAPEVAGLPPIAEAGGPYGPVNPGQRVAFDGSNSEHLDPARQIVAYQWDFDASDGLWWTSKPAPDASEGATGETATGPGYGDTGSDETYSVTLRVLDDATPQQEDTDTATVQVTTGNVPPVAGTNGPWAGIPSLNPACTPTDPSAVNNALCNPVTFDASSSSDPNAGPPLNDTIVSYEWDLDGDGSYNEGNGDDGWPQGTPATPGHWKVVKKLYQTPASGLATLRVTDSYGLQDTESDEFVSIAFVFAESYAYCYSRRPNRFTEQKGVRVTFGNIGDGTAENVVMTLTGTPANVTVVKGRAALGTMDGGESDTSDCGGTLGTSEIVWNVNLRAQPTGAWAWKAEFVHNGTPYTILNLPAIRP